MLKRIIPVTALLLALLNVGAFAQSAPPPETELTFTGPQIATLLRAFQRAMDDKTPDIMIHVSPMPLSEMPSYDPLWHYAGAAPTSALAPNMLADVTIWSTTLPMNDKGASSKALTSAVLLAVADSGYAGPDWKATYDRLAADDAALPPSVADRYTNRHRLTAKIQTLLDENAPKP